MSGLLKILFIWLLICMLLAAFAMTYTSFKAKSFINQEIADAKSTELFSGVADTASDGQVCAPPEHNDVFKQLFTLNDNQWVTDSAALKLNDGRFLIVHLDENDFLSWDSDVNEAVIPGHRKTIYLMIEPGDTTIDTKFYTEADADATTMKTVRHLKALPLGNGESLLVVGVEVYFLEKGLDSSFEEKLNKILSSAEIYDDLILKFQDFTISSDWVNNVGVADGAVGIGHGKGRIIIGNYLREEQPNSRFLTYHLDNGWTLKESMLYENETGNKLFILATDEHIYQIVTKSRDNIVNIIDEITEIHSSEEPD